jgi:hypothetical protein
VAILSALQSATMRLVGQRPSTFFGSSGQIEQEIADLVNEVAQDVAKYRDWQALIRIGTVTGDGTTTEFDLPADYDRMMLSTRVADLSSWFWGFGAYSDINAFLYDEALGFNGFPGGWVIYADHLRFSPAPESAQVATFPYITKEWARAADTNTKDAFTADDDAFLLPERLLTLGLIWRWRENKRLDATGDQEAFTKALDEYATKDRGSQVFRRNSRGHYPGTYPAYPFDLGPANYWPAG